MERLHIFYALKLEYLLHNVLLTEKSRILDVTHKQNKTICITICFMANWGWYTKRKPREEGDIGL